MAEKEQKPESAAAPAEAKEASLFDGWVDEMSKAGRLEKDEAREMLAALISEASKGTVKFDKSVSRTVGRLIEGIDQMVSRQLAAVLHAPEFQKLEGSWRGLHHLVHESETGTNLKIKVLNLPRKDLQRDMEKASEFDQSQLFLKMYTAEFDQMGGEPHGALIGDYEFSNHPEDVELLEKIAGVAAAAHCPFISAASPTIMGLDDFSELPKERDLAKIFDSPKYTRWRSFRDSEDSRYVVLTMPRVLSRLPYGQDTRKIDEFAFEELEKDPKGKAKKHALEKFTWMNAAYVMGTRLTASFAKTGFCTSIRGAENGGKVEGLPCYVFTDDEGDLDTQCPTEVSIPGRREAELSKLGFLPLCHYKNTDYAVFFGAQSAQKPKDYGPRGKDATANAAICARLPYIMAVSRVAHYLKVIGQDKIGSGMEKDDVKDFLTNWISDYVCRSPKPTEEEKARFPFADAAIEVEDVDGAGAYNAVAYLRPFLQLEELNASMRLVAKIPPPRGG